MRERFRDFEALFDLPMAVELLAYTPAEFDAMIEAGNPFIHHVPSEAIELQNSMSTLSLTAARPTRRWMWFGAMREPALGVGAR